MFVHIFPENQFSRKNNSTIDVILNRLKPAHLAIRQRALKPPTPWRTVTVRANKQRPCNQRPTENTPLHKPAPFSRIREPKRQARPDRPGSHSLVPRVFLRQETQNPPVHSRGDFP